MHFLGKNLRHLRKQLAQTQSGLADRMGKGQTTIGNWENGVSEPSLEELLALSNYFGTSVDILLKVDLAQTNWEAGKEGKKTVMYEHGKRDESVVNEDPASLSYVLHTLQRMQEEMDRINIKLNDK